MSQTMVTAVFQRFLVVLSSSKIAEEHAKCRKVSADLLFLAIANSGVPSPYFKYALFPGLDLGARIWDPKLDFSGCLLGGRERVSSPEVKEQYGESRWKKR
ncbi:hypothetical protein L1887_22059 [Cichorium endivia]|nr:hypothetical protein L1887_22059 [Cichorium endivia]